MTKGINPISDNQETKINLPKQEQKITKFPKLLEDTNYKRIKGRYTFLEFAYNLLPTSKITNVITGKQTTLNHLHKNRNIVELQALDFAGIVILREKENELQIKLGNNELVYRELDDSLIAHQVHFTRYINQSNYRAALEELHFIGLWADRAKDPIGILNYLLAQAHVNDLMGHTEVSIDYYLQAYSHLNINMDAVQIDKINHLIIESYKHRIGSNFNWTDNLSGLIFDDININNFSLYSEIKQRSISRKPVKEETGHIARLLGIKPYVRVPGRFEMKDFLHNIHYESVVQNSVTKKRYNISSLLKDNQTIFIQTLDFAGVISLKLNKAGDYEIKPAINELTLGIDEYSLLAHEMSFCMFLDRFNTRAAAIELELIKNMTHENRTRRDQFNYMMTQVRVLLRTRTKDARMRALKLLEKALDFLFTNFTNEEIFQMTRDLEIIEEKSGSVDGSNWNASLGQYDLFSLLIYYLSAAEFLHLISLQNQYGQLLEELLNDTSNGILFVKVAALEIKANLLKDAGEIHQAISCYREILEFDQSMDIFYFQGSIESVISELVRLYLQLDDLESAQQSIEYFSNYEDSGTPSTGYVNYLLADMEIYNYQKDIDGFVSVGMKIYEYLNQHEFKYLKVSKMFFIKPIFKMLIQGEYSNNRTIKERSSEIIFNVFERNRDVADSIVLAKLYRLFKAELNYSREGLSIDDLNSIHLGYRDLLQEYEKYPQYSLKKLIVHYLHFTLSHLDELPHIQSELITQTEQFIDILMESTNILLTIRSKVINMVLSRRFDELREWLQFIQPSYNLKQIEEIILQVNMISEHEDRSYTKQYLIKVVGHDLIHEEYDLYQAPPVNKVVGKVAEVKQILPPSIGSGLDDVLMKFRTREKDTSSSSIALITRYSFRGYIDSLNLLSSITDIRHRSVLLKDIRKIDRSITRIRLQAVDFFGIVTIAPSGIEIGTNDLFSQDGSAQSLVDKHKLEFCRSMTNMDNTSKSFDTLEAYVQLTEGTRDKYEEFYVLAAQGRVQYRMPYRELAKETLKAALNYLHQNFSREEIFDMSLEIARINKSVGSVNNDLFRWDSYLTGYDELNVSLLYLWSQHFDNQLTSGNEDGQLLDRIIEKAKLYENYYSLYEALDLKSDLFAAENNTLQAIETNKAIIESVEFRNSFLNDFYSYIFSIKANSKYYLSLDDITSASECIEKLRLLSTDYQDRKASSISKYSYLESLLLKSVRINDGDTVKTLDDQFLILSGDPFLKDWVSPMYFVANLFQISVYKMVNNTQTRSEIDQVLDYYISKKDHSKDVPIYRTLLQNLTKVWEAQWLLSKKDIAVIHNEYISLLATEDLTSRTQRTILFHYYYFVLLQDFSRIQMESIMKPVLEFVPSMLYETHTPSTLSKNEIISCIIREDTIALNDWLMKVRSMTGLKYLDVFANFVDKLDSAKEWKDKKTLLLDMIKPELYNLDDDLNEVMKLYPLIKNETGLSKNMDQTINEKSISNNLFKVLGER